MKLVIYWDPWLLNNHPPILLLGRKCVTNCGIKPGFQMTMEDPWINGLSRSRHNELLCFRVIKNNTCSLLQVQMIQWRRKRSKIHLKSPHPKIYPSKHSGKDPTSLPTFDKRESMKHWESRSIFMSTWPKIRKDAKDLPASDDTIRVMKARLLADKMMRLWNYFHNVTHVNHNTL